MTTSKNEETVRNLQRQIAETDKAFKQWGQDLEPSKGGARGWAETAATAQIKLAANPVMEEDNWDKKLEAYARVKLDFEKYQRSFTQTAQNIIKNGDVGKNKEDFENAAKQYYAALVSLVECQQNIAEALGSEGRPGKSSFNDRFQFIHDQYEEQKQRINAFRDTAQKVSISLADRQVEAPIRGAAVNLATAIPAIAAQYQKKYDDYGSGFWGWIKGLFKNSDRDQEINFLNEVSKCQDCNEIIRAQAVNLVHNKIIATEWFGKGSNLANILDGLSQGTITHKRDEHGGLTEFLRKHPEIQMPENLNTYMVENEANYQNDQVVRIVPE